MTATTIAAAAAARAQNVRQRGDRPSQRRSSEAATSRTAIHVRLSAVQIRQADTTDLVEFTGLASASERAYDMWDLYGPYQEIVSGDAFDDTLARADLDVPLVLAHDQLRRIARTTLGTLDLAATGEGLTVGARLDPADADVAYIVPKLRSGLIDEMSFAFRIDSGQWSPDYTEYRITKVDLHRGDVAIVGYGANPHTGAGLRAQDPPSRARALLELALAR